MQCLKHSLTELNDYIYKLAHCDQNLHTTTVNVIATGNFANELLRRFHQCPLLPSSCHFKQCREEFVEGRREDHQVKQYWSERRRSHFWHQHPFFCLVGEDCQKEGSDRDPDWNHSLFRIQRHLTTQHGLGGLFPHDVDSLRQLWTSTRDLMKNQTQLGAEHRSLTPALRDEIIDVAIRKIQAEREAVKAPVSWTRDMRTSDSSQPSSTLPPGVKGFAGARGEPISRTGRSLSRNNSADVGLSTLPTSNVGSRSVSPDPGGGQSRLASSTSKQEQQAQAVWQAVRSLLRDTVENAGFLALMSEVRKGFDQLGGMARRIPNLEDELSVYTYTKLGQQLNTLAGRIMELPEIRSILSATKTMSSSGGSVCNKTKERLLRNLIELCKNAAKAYYPRSNYKLGAQADPLLRDLTADLGLHAHQPSTRQDRPQSANPHGIPSDIRSGRPGVTRPGPPPAPYGQTY